MEETASNNNGNIRVEKLEFSGARQTEFTGSFGYDGANRITTFAEDASAKSQNFGYDSFGNIWQTAASGVPDLAQNGASWYQLAGQPVADRVKNRLNGVQYDAAGNQEALSVSGAA